jgi:hypothetical protein
LTVIGEGWPGGDQEGIEILTGTVARKILHAEQDVNGIKIEARYLLMGTGSTLKFKGTGTEPPYIESTIDSRGTDTVQHYSKDPQLIKKKYAWCYFYVESKIDSKGTGTVCSRQNADSEGTHTVLVHVDTLLNM